MATVTLQRVLLDAPTLLGAAWPESPLRTRCWREPEAERWRLQQEKQRAVMQLLPGIYRLDLLPVAASNI